MSIDKVMQAAHQYAIRFPGFARGEITADEIDAAKFELEQAVKAVITEEREACAKLCEEKAAKYYDHAKPPYLECAATIRKRSNA